MKLIVACTIILCGLSSLETFAQTNNCNFKLEGKVTDEHDASALSFSTIAILETGKGAVTDENGKYTFRNLCPGNYHFVVRHIGCEPDTVEVNISSQIQVQNFQLEHHAELLNEVKVIVEKEEQLNVLKENTIDKNRGFLFADILESIPGVSTMKTGSNVSKPVVQGFSGNRLTILNNGVALESQAWGDEHSPEIDPFTANNLTLVQGAEAVKYGGAIGGVVINEHAPMPEKIGVRGEIFLIGNHNNRMGNVSAQLEGKFERISKLSWRVQGSVKKSGNIKTPNYYQKNTGVKEHNFSYNLAYIIGNGEFQAFYSQFNSKIGVYSGAHIENLSDLNDALTRDEPRVEDQDGFTYEINRPFQYVEHETAGLKYKLRSSKFGVLDVVFSRQFNLREEYDKHLPRNATTDEMEAPEFALNLTAYSGTAKLKLLPQGIRNTEIGIEGVHRENTLSAMRDFIPEYYHQQFGGYIFNKWFYERLTVDAAIRFDINTYEVYKSSNRSLKRNDHSFSTFTLVGGMEYNLDKNIRMGIDLSFTQRPPAINELYSEGLHHGTASLEFGNPDLISETAYEIRTGIVYSIEKWRGELQIYHKQISNFIYLQPSGVALSIQGAFPVFSWRQVDVSISGFDIQSTYKVSPTIDFLASGSFLRAEDVENNSPIAFMPSNKLGGEFIYNLPEKEKVINKYISLGGKKVFKQERTPEHEILEAPDGFFLLDIGAGMEVSLKQNSMLIGLKVLNLTNTSYRDYLNRFRYFTDEQGRAIQIQIKYSF